MRASPWNRKVVSVGELFGVALEQFLGRMSGPFHLRFILQPAMSTLIAIRAGLRDRDTQQSPYLWSIVKEAHKRRILVRSGWIDIRNVFIVAVAIDCAYQIVAFERIYPVQALMVAFVLAIVPYVAIRGLVRRIATRLSRRI